MPTSFAASTTALDEEFGRAAVETTPVDTSLYRALFAHALVLGVLADLLLHESLSGLGLPLWIALLALDAIALVWRAERWLEREAGAWFVVAVCFSTGAAWRDAGALQLLDVLATAAALGMAAIALSEARAALFARRIRDTIWAAFRVISTVAAGVIPLALQPAREAAARGWVSHRWRDAARATAFAAALLAVFGSLLRGADPIFASIVAVPDVDFGVLMSHVVLTGFFTWIVGGWTRSALLARTRDLGRAPETWPISVSSLDITAALGTLNVLFGAFVVTQLGWFFGGERFLQERTGLTAAAYARGGFFEMMWVVLLIVPLLVATRALLRPGPALAKRHTLLSLPLLVLLGAMIFSAFTRMQLYVSYFGLTLERFYPMVFMGWLGVVLAWLAVTVLRGRPHYFFAGAIISGLAALGALNVAAPDVVVARINIAHSTDAKGAARPALDLAYLSSLSGEAVRLAVQATLSASPSSDAAQRCRAATNLLQRWGSTSRRARRGGNGAAWREWNAGIAGALGAVAERSAELRRVAHDACANEKRNVLRRGVAAR